MNRPKIKSTTQPESLLKTRWREYLINRGWFTQIIHGNAYSSGFPDLFATHKQFRIRLIEIKLPGRTGDLFTAAQRDIFPKLMAYGADIWILQGLCDEEYAKLFKPANAWFYLSDMHR